MNNNERQAETEAQQSDAAELLPSAPLAAIPMLGDVLSLQQAKMVAITEGKKIKHRFYIDGEFIKYKKGKWVAEDGYFLPVGYFESMNVDWLTGWSEYIA